MKKKNYKRENLVIKDGRNAEVKKWKEFDCYRENEVLFLTYLDHKFYKTLNTLHLLLPIKINGCSEEQSLLNWVSSGFKEGLISEIEYKCITLILNSIFSGNTRALWKENGYISTQY